MTANQLRFTAVFCGIMVALAIMVGVVAATVTSSSQSVYHSSSGGNNLQEVTQNGKTTGQCSYVDGQGRKVELSYTKDTSGKVDVTSKPPFVSDPKAAYHQCLLRNRPLTEAPPVAEALVDPGATSHGKAIGERSVATAQGSDESEISQSSPSQRVVQSSYNRGDHSNQSRRVINNSYSTGDPPIQSQRVVQSSYNRGHYPSQTQRVVQTSYDKESSPSQSERVVQTSYIGRSPSIQTQTVVQSPSTFTGMSNLPIQTQIVTQNSRHERHPTRTQTVIHSTNKGSGGRSVITSSHNGATYPYQSQSVSQTSSGGSVQHQEVTQNGVTTGVCSYVDKRGRNIKVNYKIYADGRREVDTEPPVKNAERHFKKCRKAAVKESEKLEKNMKAAKEEMEREFEDIFGQMRS